MRFDVIARITSRPQLIPEAGSIADDRMRAVAFWQLAALFILYMAREAAAEISKFMRDGRVLEILRAIRKSYAVNISFGVGVIEV